MDRGLNTGIQTFDTDKSKFPLYQPIPKLESFPQVSGKIFAYHLQLTFFIQILLSLDTFITLLGEAEFINDMQIKLNELFGAFVLTTVANGTIASVDASKALVSTCL